MCGSNVTTGSAKRQRRPVPERQCQEIQQPPPRQAPAVARSQGRTRQAGTGDRPSPRRIADRPIAARFVNALRHALESRGAHRRHLRRRSARGLRRLGALPAPARRGAAGGGLVHRVGVIPPARRRLTHSSPTRPAALRRVGLPLSPGRGTGVRRRRRPSAGEEDEVAGAEASESTPTSSPSGSPDLRSSSTRVRPSARRQSLTSGWLPARCSDYRSKGRLPHLGLSRELDGGSWAGSSPATRSMRSKPNGRHRRPRERLDRHQAARALSPRLRGTARHCAFVGRHLVAERLLRFVPRCRRVWGAHGDTWPQTRPTATRTVGSRIGSPV